MADTPAADPPSESIRGQLAFQEGQDTEAPRDFVGGSGFGQSSSDTYGGMSGGQMVALENQWAAWPAALTLFFAAMLEHRVKEYENFMIFKKERWEGILKRVLQLKEEDARVPQGLPERKRRKPDQDDPIIHQWDLKAEVVVSLWITVPAGQGPGASVEVEHEGRKYQVVVPAGAEAGSVFVGQIQVSAGPAPLAEGAGVPNFVLSGVKAKNDRRRRRYVHQGEVLEVLMGFLREQPTLANLPFRLEHAGKSLADIKRKVEAKYCNIPDEVIQDLFRALDLCYYLSGIRNLRPAGAVAFEKHPDLKYVKDDLRHELDSLLKEQNNLDSEQFRHSVCLILNSKLRLGFETKRAANKEKKEAEQKEAEQKVRRLTPLAGARRGQQDMVNLFPSDSVGNEGEGRAHLRPRTGTSRQTGAAAGVADSPAGVVAAGAAVGLGEEVVAGAACAAAAAADDSDALQRILDGEVTILVDNVETSVNSMVSKAEQQGIPVARENLARLVQAALSRVLLGTRACITVLGPMPEAPNVSPLQAQEPEKVKIDEKKEDAGSGGSVLLAGILVPVLVFVILAMACWWWWWWK